MLQWTWEYRYVFNIVVSFPLDVYPELELLDYGRAIFNFSRNLHTVLSSNCTSLHPYQECRSVPFSPHPHQHFLSLVFLIMDILLITLYLLCFPYVQWCGALFHVPINDSGVFFGKTFIQFLCPFFQWLFAIELFIYMSYLYTFGINSSTDIWFESTFFHFISCLLIFGMLLFLCRSSSVCCSLTC